jgi:hypothetical protein
VDVTTFYSMSGGLKGKLAAVPAAMDSCISQGELHVGNMLVILKWRSIRDP